MIIISTNTERIYEDMIESSRQKELNIYDRPILLMTHSDGVKLKRFVSQSGQFHQVEIVPKGFGSVYSWGHDRDGELGLGSELRANRDKHLSTSKNIYVTRPAKVKELNGKNIKKLACGDSHTLALSENHGIFSWGKGEQGQLGHTDLKSYDLPRAVDTLRDKLVTDVACGPSHSVATVHLRQIYE
eukprot:CAMPEP_0115002878 /NCGR_PEP_ID=MMETSP0216-20121206/18265_1 /TAXON_ID=223996 /ORGANISM="Protocruzia adherens, Strain Boccale" /LENGTH=185 /DNA_ID=CAMNT_0002368551 /DNA_START=156 /DNA_END=713 /DNA_ORIENTATION=-